MKKKKILSSYDSLNIDEVLLLLKKLSFKI
jgi:hypothetical protein